MGRRAHSGNDFALVGLMDDPERREFLCDAILAGQVDEVEAALGRLNTAQACLIQLDCLAEARIRDDENLERVVMRLEVQAR